MASLNWVVAALVIGFICGQLFGSSVPPSARSDIRSTTQLADRRRPFGTDVVKPLSSLARPIAPLRPIGQGKKRDAFCRATATQSVGTSNESVDENSNIQIKLTPHHARTHARTHPHTRTASHTHTQHPFI